MKIPITTWLIKFLGVSHFGSSSPLHLTLFEGERMYYPQNTLVPESLIKTIETGQSKQENIQIRNGIPVYDDNI